MTDLYEHQELALRKLSNGKILWGGVGTGKSRVAATYYMRNEAPKDVYVITTARKRDSFDWQEEFYRLGIGPRSGPSGPGRVLPKSHQSNGSSGTDALGTETSHGDAESFIGGVRAEREAGPVQADGSELAEGIQDRTRGELDTPGSRRASFNLDDVRERGDQQAGSDATHGLDGSHPQLQQDGKQAGPFPWVLTVDSWNNIAKYADVAGAFFIFDEQRLVGSGDWTRKFLRIAKHNRWILLSGTPGDTWMDYVPVFVANNFYKNRTEFKREHVVYNTFTKFPKVDRYINVGRLVRQRAQLLVEMPYVRHTRRRHVEVPLHYEKETLDLVLKKRWHVYEDRPLRDIAEMCSVSRRVVNSDPSRLEMVKQLWQNHPKLIVFYNFNYELESLRTLAESFEIQKSQNQESRSVIGQSKSSLSHQIGMKNDLKGGLSSLIAEWNGHKHQEIPKTDRWVYLVQYAAGAEAWNCTETDAMILHSKNYSWKITEQAYGRIDRLDTPFKDLWYYRFTSDSWIDRAIERALKAKQTFNESRYKGLFKE